ncbi:hypothetical protein [Nonomuraea sp. SYSU D8015]|uniref:hypothetical protein n=1 Tax=Nonomuraea sp. SYSU D8015 TaxID=2593644 RepID=UPI001660CB9D|nr:hypothetical protein [Nonomuraea sp. SYSU D8015]
MKSQMPCSSHPAPNHVTARLRVDCGPGQRRRAEPDHADRQELEVAGLAQVPVDYAPDQHDQCQGEQDSGRRDEVQQPEPR